MWDLRLVDPDNRAPVDYAHLRKLISGLGNPSEMRVACRDSRIKLHVVREALRLRRAHPDVFVGGSYEPIHAGDDITAFSRGDAAIFVTTRRRWGVMAGKQPWAIGAAWKDRTLPFPNGTFRDVLTGQTVEGGTLALETLLKVLPVALLLRH